MYSLNFLNPNRLVLLFLLFRYGSCNFDVVVGEASVDVTDVTIISSDDEALQHAGITTTSVKFFLITPAPDNQTIEINSTDHFLNSSQPIKLLIHGASETQYSEWVDQVATIYHMKGDYNVVVVDWSRIATEDSFFYASAINETGAIIAEFVMEVTQDTVEGLRDVHVIGNGVGAHIGGAAGRKAADRNNTKLGRITGLDPENSTYTVDQVLDPQDAEFVDIIHTSAQSGYDSYGTVDFYVLSNNTGTPICINDTCIVAEKATDFFILSLLDKDRYEAVSCDNETAFIEELCNDADKAVLGEYVDKNATGRYYLSPSSAYSIYPNNVILAVVLAFTVLYILNI